MSGRSDIDAIFQAVAQQVQSEAEAAGQMTLGGFIAALEALPQGARVLYAGTSSCPSDPDSYRGFYDQLAFANWEGVRSVADVLAEARNAMGRSFEGYKGGTYWMRADTMLWRAEYGVCGDRIVGVAMGGATAIVKTAPYED